MNTNVIHVNEIELSSNKAVSICRNDTVLFWKVGWVLLNTLAIPRVRITGIFYNGYNQSPFYTTDTKYLEQRPRYVQTGLKNEENVLQFKSVSWNAKLRRIDINVKTINNEYVHRCQLKKIFMYK